MAGAKVLEALGRRSGGGIARRERPVLICSAVIGTLKGYDQLMNLVLDEVKEALTGTKILLYLKVVKLTPWQTTKATSGIANSAS